MSKPRAAHAPFAAQSLPPRTGFMPVIAHCPHCDRFAFGIVETTQPALVGQKPTSRLAGIECPWCLTITQYDADGQHPPVICLPTDMAAQVRAALTTQGAEAQSTAGGPAITGGECDAGEEEPAEPTDGTRT